MRIFEDLPYTLRMLRRNPAFAATAVVTLALGIGGNASMFTVIRAVLWKPLGYQNPDRLVRVTLGDAAGAGQDFYFSLLRYEDLSAATKACTALGASFATTEDMTLAGSGEPEALRGARVSANVLDILGAAPMLGRGFLREEDRRGGRPVALISTALWRRHFGSDRSVTGKSVSLNATPYTIVGVLPEGFDFPFPGVDVWVARPAEYSALPPQTWDTVAVLVGIARLKPGVGIERARAELNVLNHEYSSAHPGLRDVDPRSVVRVVSLRDQMVANVRPTLWMLFGAVGFVLLIACANVASLLLARGVSRAREFAVRAAVGASRGRLVRQLLTESVLLAAAGGTFGIAVARWGVRAIAHWSSLPTGGIAAATALPRAGEIHLDGTILAFTLAVSLATGVLFGLLPSLRASRPDLAGVLRESGAGAGRAAGRTRALGVSSRGLLVMMQVALSVVLLIGAALLLESIGSLRSVAPGFQPTNLLTIRLALPLTRYNDAVKRVAFDRELTERIAALPGVRGVTLAQTLPMRSPHYGSAIQVAEQPILPLSQRPSGLLQSVWPGYFRTLGIALRRGREFTAADNAPGAPPAIVINESLARRMWPSWPRGQDPLGQHILMGNQSPQSRGLEIIGIAADVHEVGLANDPGPEMYLPTVLRPPQALDVGVRTSGDPMRLAAAIRGAVRAIDRDQAVSDIQTESQVVDVSLGQRHLTLLLLEIFAGVALLLAMLGIYGAIAYSVAQRTQEVGIRRALGAQHSDILRMVLKQALGLTAAGLAIGIGGALALTRVMRTLLFHVSATDPATFAGVTVFFAMVALAAGLVPAKRAATIDPMAALR